MTICYFGIYNPKFSRNRIYVKGLRELGVSILECRDQSKGLLKFWRLWQKHRVLPSYDAMMVGYAGHLVVPLAKLISKGPVIADLLGSLSDAEINSHQPSLLRRIKSILIDWLAVLCADHILLETEAQKQYFEQRFGPSKKYHVVYTGVDESVFHCEVKNSTESTFLVLFRGSLTPECGITHILEAAKLLLADPHIRFRILGRGVMQSQAEAIIKEQGLTNVELISAFLSEENLREKMCSASISLGQFDNNQRLARTIPHKAFESFAMGLPYLTGEGEAVKEIIRDGETGFLVPLANVEALAEKIRALSKNRSTLTVVGQNAYKLFTDRFTAKKLARSMLALV